MTDQTDHLQTRFAEIAHEMRERPFLIDSDRTMSWAEVDKQARQLASGLAVEGLVPGDRLGIDLPNGIEWVVTLLAAAYAGLVVVPLDPGLRYHELKYQLRHAGVAGVVIPEAAGPPDFLEIFDKLLPELPELRLISYVGPGERWFDDRGVPFKELVERGARNHAASVIVDTEETLALIYTSGTMGKPKGVLLSSGAMLQSARSTANALEVDDRDRVLLGVPLFHVFGLSILLSAIEARASVVLLELFDPDGALKAIERDAVTFLPGTPTMFELMMRSESFRSTDLSTLTGGVVGGAAVSAVAIDRIRHWCDAEIAYGLTEAGPTVSVTRRSDPEEKRRTTTGRPVDGVEVGVVDLRRGTLHVDDAVGELAVRSDTIMRGYHRMPHESSLSFTVSGHLLTGDLVHIDEDGYLSIVARRREVIVRAGQSITPGEIEDLLRTHPGVESSCVVGVPDDVLGELVIACVVLVEGAVVTGDELRRFCQDSLAASKVPDRVRFLESFPMTASGKIRRLELSRAMDLDINRTG